ncbi:MAG: lipoprotein [Neisseria sp.]|nr:lipoprotein [Neisseria sp.]
MKKRFYFAIAALLCLSACGYKGDLYLPKDGDKARFGVIQTGLDVQPVHNTPSQSEQK